jgi:hypothetical protein
VLTHRGWLEAGGHSWRSDYGDPDALGILLDHDPERVWRPLRLLGDLRAI